MVAYKNLRGVWSPEESEDECSKTYQDEREGDLYEDSDITIEDDDY